MISGEVVDRGIIVDLSSRKILAVAILQRQIKTDTTRKSTVTGLTFTSASDF